MNKLVLVAVLATLACASYAAVYKWTDSQGNVHFSDVPHEGAERLKIPEAQTFSSPASRSQPRSGSQSATEPEALTVDQSKGQTNVYSKIIITRPENQATIRNNQGAVVITAQVEPRLKRGDSVQLIYDGAPIGAPQHNLTFQVRDVYRGAHTISVKLLSPDGATILTSEPITFYMHRPRVGMVRPGGN